jgi:hypothetical protein
MSGSHVLQRFAPQFENFLDYSGSAMYYVRDVDEYVLQSPVFLCDQLATSHVSLFMLMSAAGTVERSIKCQLVDLYTWPIPL